MINIYLMIAVPCSYSQDAKFCLYIKAYTELRVCPLRCLFKCNQTLSISFPTTGILQLEIISLLSQIVTIPEQRVKLQTSWL